MLQDRYSSQVNKLFNNLCSLAQACSVPMSMYAITWSWKYGQGKLILLMLSSWNDFNYEMNG